MLTMFTYALGGVDLDIMLGSSNPEASILLSLLYQFAMATVLMSLLTGMAQQGRLCKHHALCAVDRCATAAGRQGSSQCAGGCRPGKLDLHPAWEQGAGS
jgi:hypothetical protein